MRTIIIAEAGVNHNGSLENAIALVKAAAAAGADYVKFQTFKTELNISKTAKKADYQEKNTGNSESQFAMVKKLELSFEDFLLIKDKCDEYRIGFMSTGFDIPSIDFLNSLSPEYFKIPSGEITNKPYLEYIGRIAKKVILSTGMSNLEEIRQAVEILQNVGVQKENLTILHCNTEYPTPFSEVNLLAMHHIKKEIGVEIGYSDHTLGIEVPIAAVALGARIIEKHFTLDRNMPGPDHIASLEPDELKAMVSAIRNIEAAIAGDGLKQASNSEMKNKEIARKSLHYATAMRKGEQITAAHLIALRPGNGISPMDIEQVTGKILLEDVEGSTQVKTTDFA